MPEMDKLEVDHIIELEQCTYQQAIDPNNLRTLFNYHTMYDIVFMVHLITTINGMMNNGSISG